MLTIRTSLVTGATNIIAIDDVPYRLEYAKQRLGVSTINFKVDDVNQTLAKVTMVNSSLVFLANAFLSKLCPGGPDACIDCAGFRFPTR